MPRGDHLALGFALGALWAPAAAAQQQAPAPPPVPGDDPPAVYVDEQGSIVVTVRPPRGSVIGNVPPELVLDADDIRATGAGNIGELVETLRPQLNVPQGGAPIVLLNGRRIASLEAIRIYPREAIERTDILPPHVALSYGYPAESRVMNIVLRQSYRGATGELAGTFATEGGRDGQEASLSFLTIAGDNRLSFGVRFDRDSNLRESERGIVQPAPAVPFDLIGNVTGAGPASEIDPALTAIAGRPVTVAGVPIAALNGPATIAEFAALANDPNFTDIGWFRTLLPSGRRLDLSAELTRLVGSLTLSVSGRYGRSVNESLLGLAPASLRVLADSPFSPFSQDVILYRFLDPADPLGRRTTSDSAQLMITLSGLTAGWTWTNIATLEHSRNVAHTDTGLDLLAVQDRILAGDPLLNPFGDLSGEARRDVSRLSTTRLANVLNLTRPLLRLPAGPMQVGFLASYDSRFTDRESERSGFQDSSETSRYSLYSRGVLNLPIASRSSNVLPLLGELSILLTGAVQSQTASPAQLAFGYGATWQPIGALELSANMTTMDRAASDEQLNAPLVETPNVRRFDFRNGETVELLQLSGGNPALLAPRATNLHLMAAATLSRQPLIRARASYMRMRIEDPVGALLTPTPELEAAFPDRFLRDADGRLIRLDARPVNFLRSERSTLSGDVSIVMQLGSQPAPARRTSPSASLPAASARESAPRGGRLIGSIGLEHGLNDELLIRQGIPRIDLFESAYGGGSGRSRLSVNYSLSVLYNGVQATLRGTSTSGRTVRSGQSALDYSGLSLVKAQLSFDFGSRPEWVRRSPFFSGLSVRLDVDNLLNDRLRVIDQAGETPLSFQPAYLDPLGRSVRLSLRKTF